MRLAKPDLREQNHLPPDLDTDSHPALGYTLRVPVAGWAMKDISYTFLAACRNSELVNEYRATHEQGFVTHGAFTFFLLQTIGHLRSDVRYDELMERVAAKVNARHPRQMLQCEGNRGRAIFNGALIERDLFTQFRE